DRVHSATLAVRGETQQSLGCLVYIEDRQQFSYFPRTGDFDECQIDKSGRWLLIKEQVDGLQGDDNVVVDLQTGIQRFLLDDSGHVLVVAPVMTDLQAAGGGDDYSKAPMGNLDVTGQYFIWTSNMGGPRLDAFIVKIPAQLLPMATHPTARVMHAGPPRGRS